MFIWSCTSISQLKLKNLFTLVVRRWAILSRNRPPAIFSPPDTTAEREHYSVNLEDVTNLELTIILPAQLSRSCVLRECPMPCRLSAGNFSEANVSQLIPLKTLTCQERIKSDTPPSPFTTLAAVLCLKNIGFHYVWTVAYPLPLDRCGHESKVLSLAAHG